jgi:transcriptional antiterminator RfaH
MMHFDRQWYAVYCQAGKERTARDQLINQNFDVYLPEFKKIVHHARRVIEKKSPLFPRYLFASFDKTNDAWRSINSTRGVIGLVKAGNGIPQSIHKSTINNLKTSEDESGLVSLAALELFDVGQNVRILEGAFAGHIASYQKLTDDQRVEILLHFLTKDVRLQVSAHAIEKTT